MVQGTRHTAHGKDYFEPPTDADGRRHFVRPTRPDKNFMPCGRHKRVSDRIDRIDRFWVWAFSVFGRNCKYGIRRTELAAGDWVCPRSSGERTGRILIIL
jgi:hypothetical protein